MNALTISLIVLAVLLVLSLINIFKMVKDTKSGKKEYKVIFTKKTIIPICIIYVLGYFLFYTILYLTKYPNYYLWPFLLSFILTLVFLPFVLTINKKQATYKSLSIFTKEYWRSSAKELTKIKNLVIMSALLAMILLTKLIPLPSGFGDLGITFSFIFMGVACLLYGPLAGLLLGFVIDNLEFVLIPSGYPYFFGYTLSSMLTGFIYGLLFYKQRINFFKVFIARVFINLLINAVLGTVWMGIVADYSSFDMYVTRFIFIALPKNLVYLIPQSILLYAVIRALANVLVRANLIDVKVKESMGLY